MRIFQLICDDHTVLFSNKKTDEWTSCPYCPTAEHYGSYMHLSEVLCVIQDCKTASIRRTNSKKYGTEQYFVERTGFSFSTDVLILHFI